MALNSRNRHGGSIDCEYYSSNTNRSRRIVFFSTDINSAIMEDTFIFMAQTAKKLGHDVVIVTTNCERKLIDNQLSSLKVYQIGQMIPKFFCGLFYLPLYYLRTIYSTLWLLKMKSDLNPTFVVVQRANAVIPFLKLVGKLHIVQIHTFTDQELIQGTTDNINIKGKRFHQFCINHADEIIVSNKLSRQVFCNTFAEMNKSPAVLYPCVDTSAFERSTLIKLKNIIRVPDDAIIFVAFGPMRKSSNFEILISAFSLLLEQTKTSYPNEHIHLYLVIAGHYEDTKEYSDYSTELQFSALKLCHEKPCVLFLTAVPLTFRKSLMHKCVAVLHPMILSLDGRTILEAGLMRKPVLAANSGIAVELISEGVNGFLIPPVPMEFARCMHALLYSKQNELERSRKVYFYFKKHFSMLRYSCELQNLVIRNSRHVIDLESVSNSSILRI